MFKKILSFISGAPVEKVAEYFVQKQQLKQDLKLANLRGKQDLAKAKWEAKAAKQKAKAEQQQFTNSWEMAQIANSGYKDEVVLAVILYPYIGSFIPKVQDTVLVGFQYLEQMPYWAVGLTVTIFLAIYGIRHRNASRISAPGLRDKDVADVKE